MSLKFIAHPLRSAASRFERFADQIDPRPIVEVDLNTPHQQWLRADGDRTLRMEYPLSESDVVLDVGGFEGQWASDIFSRYLCTVHIFEPIPQFAENIVSRFAKNDRIHIHQCGLGDRDGELDFSVEGDASSSVVSGATSIKAPILAFDHWASSNDLGEVGLIKINIEGGEYPLIEHLIDSGWIKKIRNLQVQFHDFVPEAESRMAEIKRRLAETHHPTYQYKFIWENWTLARQ